MENEEKDKLEKRLKQIESVIGQRSPDSLWDERHDIMMKLEALNKNEPVNQDYKEKNSKDFVDMLMKEEKEGNVVFASIDGLSGVNLKNLVSQPTDGLLYDLNRDRATVLNLIENDPKRVNDFAVCLVITELKTKLEESDRKIMELEKQKEFWSKMVLKDFDI